MHTRAVSRMKEAAQAGLRIVTSDYVLDETATLLRTRRQRELTEALFERAFASRSLTIEWMDPERFDETIKLFLKHRDQNWSFTDCFSFRLMRSLRITNALTKDKHFQQAGFNALLIP